MVSRKGVFGRSRQVDANDRLMFWTERGAELINSWHCHFNRRLTILSICLSLCVAPVLADDAYFNSQLQLPTLPGFESFYQSAPAPAGNDSFRRWQLDKPSPDVKPTAYLLANPKEKLWVTIRRGEAKNGKADNTPVSLKDFDRLLAPVLTVHHFSVSDTTYQNYDAGPTCTYTISGGLADGYFGWLVCLTPKSDRSPKEAFFLTIVYTRSSIPLATKLVMKLMKEGRVSPS